MIASQGKERKVTSNGDCKVNTQLTAIYTNIKMWTGYTPQTAAHKKRRAALAPQKTVRTCTTQGGTYTRQSVLARHTQNSTYSTLDSTSLQHMEQYIHHTHRTVHTPHTQNSTYTTHTEQDIHHTHRTVHTPHTQNGTYTTHTEQYVHHTYRTGYTPHTQNSTYTTHTEQYIHHTHRREKTYPPPPP